MRRVDRTELERIAKLAALAVDDEALSVLTAQVERILDYVSQLESVMLPEDSAPFHPGPERLPLRPDEVTPTPLLLTPQVMAPVFRDGLFIVPSLPGMESA